MGDIYPVITHIPIDPVIPAIVGILNLLEPAVHIIQGHVRGCVYGFLELLNHACSDGHVQHIAHRLIGIGRVPLPKQTAGITC